MSIYKPHDYQVKAEHFIYDHDGAGLFLDMGLGKTVVTLTAIKNLQWDINKTLVIAPKRPAIDTWPEELKKWDHLKGLSYSLVVGSSADRRRALKQKASIYIINRENVSWLVQELQRSKWPFDCVVVDELSSFKSSKAQRFRALKKVRPYIKRFIGLTGTPAGNGYMDLWAECFLLDGGKALGRTLTSYRDIYFTPGRRNGHVVYDWKLKKGAKEKILDRIKPFCISMKTEDYLSLPERLDIEKPFALSDKQMKKYKKLEREYILDLDESVVDAVNAAVLNTKLLQVSSGAIYDENKAVKYIHDEKLAAFAQLVEEAEGENILVFYNFTHEKERILGLYPDARDVREPGAIDQWKAGKLKMMLAHPASAGHGLNLQSGGCVSIWFGLTTSLELYQQAIKRLHRQGQTKTVRNYILLAKGTYEETVYREILLSKEERQNALLEVLKAKIQEVKHDC